METMGNIEDTDIDIAIDEGEADERRAQELAHRIRMVAAADPVLAQTLVDQLIDVVDQALDGTFRERLDRASDS